jgi:hypothetical protein
MDYVYFFFFHGLSFLPSLRLRGSVDVIIPRQFRSIPDHRQFRSIPETRSKPDIAARTTSFAALAAHFLLARRV